VLTDETFVLMIGNQAMTGKAVTPSDPVVDAESPNHYVWVGSGASTDSDEPGGPRLFAIDIPTGQIVWIRTSASADFTGFVDDPMWRTGRALTANGELVSPAGGTGHIDGAPLDLGAPVLMAIAPTGPMSAIGSFATLSDGTLVAFGGIPFSQQG
jgi:hypothetical protein